MLVSVNRKMASRKRKEKGGWEKLKQKKAKSLEEDKMDEISILLRTNKDVQGNSSVRPGCMTEFPTPLWSYLDSSDISPILLWHPGISFY